MTSSKEDFLLAPQRYLKRLISQGNVDLDAAEESLRAAALSKQQVKGKQGRAKPISLLEKKFYLNQKTSIENNNNVKIINEIYSYISTKSVIYLALCSKMLYSNVLQLKQFKGTLSMKEFFLFYKYGTKGKRIQNFGVLRDKMLSVTQTNDTANNEDVEIYVEIFTNFIGGFSLRKFQISINTNVGDLEIGCFMSSLKNPKVSLHLEDLNLCNSTLGNDGLSLLADLIKENLLPNLLNLDISHNSLTDNVIQKLRLCLSQGHCNQLYKLNLSGNNICAAILDFFYSPFVGKLSPISIFDASNNTLDLLDLNVLPVLSRGKLSFFHLKNLDLSYNPLGDTGFVRLLKIAWSLKKTNPLNSPKPDTNASVVNGVDSPTGTIRSMDDLRSPSNTSSKWDLTMYDDIPLESLHLNHTVIGDASMLHICNLIQEKRLGSLVTLSMKGNEISAATVKVLLMDVLKFAESLTQLYLSLNNFSNDGIIFFTQAAVARFLDQLIILDIADVGANSDSISQFLRVLSTLDPTTGNLRMTNLSIYGKSGMHKLRLPKEFLVNVV